MARKTKENGSNVMESPVQYTEVLDAHPLAVCQPRGDRVVVRRDPARTRSAGGVILPDAAAAKQQLGTVISIGPGRLRDDGVRVTIDLRVGDRVIVTGYAGLELRDPLINREEADYLILREEDVVAVLP